MTGVQTCALPISGLPKRTCIRRNTLLLEQRTYPPLDLPKRRRPQRKRLLNRRGPRPRSSNHGCPWIQKPDAEDARLAADGGADAIIVSNHGGRQLDSASSSIAALPSIVDAIGDRVEVLFDGGIRSGQDVIKALALGAKSCLIGRAFLYGLGAMGEAGVRLALEILRKELDFSMALTGVCDVSSVSRAVLIPPKLN